MDTNIHEHIFECHLIKLDDIRQTRIVQVKAINAIKAASAAEKLHRGWFCNESSQI